MELACSLVQVKKEPEKTLGPMMVRCDVTALEGPQSLCANEGDQARWRVNWNNLMTETTEVCCDFRTFGRHDLQWDFSTFFVFGYLLGKMQAVRKGHDDDDDDDES